LIGIVKVAALVGVIAAEADVIHQEVTQGRDLSTVDYGKAAKTGVVAAGATAAGGLAGAGALAGTAALGIGGAAGSAAISGTVGGAVAGYTGSAAGTLAEGGSLAEAHDRGAIGALTGAIGGTAGQAAGSVAARAGAGRVASAFVAGATGDYASQQTLVGAGLQEEANLTQSLAVGGASALTGLVSESTRGSGLAPSPRPLGSSNRIQTTVGNLRRAELRDAHHIVQDAAVRDLPGYNTELAPGVQLPGPANRLGTQHSAATRVQQERGGGTYAAERRIAYKALRRAGLTPQEALAEIQRADDYFRSIGVTPTTSTRVPGNRR
jgi:hypothetical protein